MEAFVLFFGAIAFLTTPLLRSRTHRERHTHTLALPKCRFSGSDTLVRVSSWPGLSRV